MPKVFQKTLEGGRIEVSEKRPPGYWHGVQRLRFSGGASPFATPGEVRKVKLTGLTYFVRHVYLEKLPVKPGQKI